MTLIVDGHADVAWNAFTFGRDVMRSAFQTRELEHGSPIPEWNLGQALVGWPEWLLGRVAVVFASLFAAPRRLQERAWDHVCYADADEAHRLLRKQLDFYERLVEHNPDRLALIRTLGDLEGVLAGWQGEGLTGRRVGLVLMIEGADGVRQPDELPEWHARGVRILAPAWAGTRYAGGTGEPGPFTKDGRALLEAMAGLGMMLDLTHLDDSAVLEGLDTYPGVVLASHSNPRTLADSKSPNRHLTDVAIRRLAERGGVMGIVPYNRFLKKGWEFPDPRGGITLDSVQAHIDHVCQLVGDARHVGLGSDFDGGFGLESIPVGLDSVADLRLIGPVLEARGYEPTEALGVLGGNWLALLRRALPET
jgi:membrane dipeptidase